MILDAINLAIVLAVLTWTWAATTLAVLGGGAVVSAVRSILAGRVRRALGRPAARRPRPRRGPGRRHG